MQILRKTLVVLWRLWFYTLVLSTILVLSPVLLISLFREQWYPYFFKLARLWAYVVYYGMGFRLQHTNRQHLQPNQSYMFIANHTSVIDIMLMLILLDTPFVFVGKAELAKIPIFGFFYKRTCILVDRSSAESRQATLQKATEKLSKGLSICIFPEGGVPDDTQIVLDEFKDGAFRLAIEFQIPIAAYTIVGLKQAFPFDFFKGKPARIQVVQHPICSTVGIQQNQKRELKNQLREQMLQTLQAE